MALFKSQALLIDTWTLATQKDYTNWDWSCNPEVTFSKEIVMYLKYLRCFSENQSKVKTIVQLCKNNCTNPVKAHTSGACRGLLLWRLNIPQQASGGQYLLTTLFRPTLLLWTGQKWTFIYLDYDHGRFNNIMSCCGGWHRVSEINYMYFQKRKLNITKVKLPWQWQFWTVMVWVWIC